MRDGEHEPLPGPGHPHVAEASFLGERLGDGMPVVGEEPLLGAHDDHGVALNIGKDLGLLPTDIFSTLVLMAIISTFMATPLIRRLMRDQRRPGPAPGELALAPVP